MVPSGGVIVAPEVNQWMQCGEWLLVERYEECYGQHGWREKTERVYVECLRVVDALVELVELVVRKDD